MRWVDISKKVLQAKGHISWSASYSQARAAQGRASEVLEMRSSWLLPSGELENSWSWTKESSELLHGFQQLSVLLHVVWQPRFGLAFSERKGKDQRIKPWNTWYTPTGPGWSFSSSSAHLASSPKTPPRPCSSWGRCSPHWHWSALSWAALVVPDQVHPFGLVIPGKVGFRLKVLESINQSRGRQVLFSRVEVISGAAKHYTENVANQVPLEYTKIEKDPDKIKMDSLKYNPGS